MTPKPGGASLDSYRAAFEQASDAMLIHDGSGTVIDANETAADLFGRGREQMREQTLADLHPDIGRAVGEAVADGSTQTEVRIEDGSTTVRLTVTVERVGGDQFLARVCNDTNDTTDPSVLHEERQLEAIVENLPVVLFVLDPEGTFTMSRGRGLDSLGLDPGELNGVSVFDAYADYPDIVETVDQALDGEAVRVEQEVGDLVFETQYRPVTDEDGTVQQVIGVSLDVTEHRQQEQEFQTLLEAVPAGVFMTQVDGTVEFINDEAQSIIGLEDDLEGRKMSEILRADQIHGFEEHHAEALDQRGPVKREHSFETDAGTRTMEAIVAPVTDASGEAYAVVGVAQDITERKARKEKLKRNDAILEQLTETTEDVLWLFNSDFTELQFVNDSYEEVWGREVADLQDDAMDFIEGVHPDDRDTVFGAVEQLQNGESSDLEYRVNPQEDYGRWVRVKGEPVYRDGEVVRAAGFARDITERKERERKLQKSNERLEQFAYVASHDLQEPLRTISNYTEMLAEDYADSLDEEAQRIVDVIVTGSERMQSMIDGLLDYSRVTTRGGEFESVDADEVVDDVATDLGAILEEEGGNLEWDDLPTVEADRDQLRQVVQNLVKNALEHADESADVEVRGTDTGESYRFEVEDNGPGIAESRQEKIFRIFKSSHQYQTSSQAKGIGLAICDQIIDRHGGDIWVESEPGEGATFVFTIDKEKRTDDGGDT